MKARPLFLLLLLAVLPLLAAQSAPRSVSAADLEPLLGTWQGIYTYTEEDNSARQVTMPTTVVITRAGSPKSARVGVRWAFTHTAPGAERIEYITEMLAAKAPGQLAFDGQWLISEKASTPGTLALTLEGEGRDAGRRALLRELLRVTADSLLHTRLVRHAGADSFFVRNRLALARQP